MHGLVNLGGDVRVIGPAPDGTPWRIAIQHPRGAAGEKHSHGSMSRAAALATSGDYERYFVVDGRRYCHVMDPRTGWPVGALAVGVGRRAADGRGRSVCHVAMLHAVADRRSSSCEAQGVRYLAIDASGQRHAA